MAHALSIGCVGDNHLHFRRLGVQGVRMELVWFTCCSQYLLPCTCWVVISAGILKGRVSMHWQANLHLHPLRSRFLCALWWHTHVLACIVMAHACFGMHCGGTRVFQRALWWHTHMFWHTL